MTSAVRPTVLLVDDNLDLLDLLTRSLQHLGGFNILRAQDGIAGLEQAMTGRPDCVIVDIMMPGLDGYQLVRALRGDPASSNIPIVILTALAEDANRLAGLLTGADQYLVKPVRPQDLIAAIQQAVALSQDKRLQRLQALVEETGVEDEL